MKKANETKFLKCAKKDEVPEILNTFHDVSGHDGINSTYRNIANEFYWKGMSTDVKEYVSVIFTTSYVTGLSHLLSFTTLLCL